MNPDKYARDLARALRYSGEPTLQPTHYTVYSTSRDRTWTEEPRRKRDRKPLELHEALDLSDTLQANAEARGGGNGHTTWIGAVYPDGSRRVWPHSHSPGNATYVLDNRNNETTVTPHFDRPMIAGRRVPLDADHTALDSYGKATEAVSAERLLTRLHSITGWRSGLADSMKRKGLGWDSEFWKQAMSLREAGLKTRDWTPWLALADLIDEHEINPHIASIIRSDIQKHQDGGYGYIGQNNY